MKIPPIKQSIKNFLIKNSLTDDERTRIDEACQGLNSAGFDDWGLDPETLKATLGAVKWLYEDYFRVDVTGMENLPEGRVLLIANHGGQIPIDGMVVGMSLLLKGNPPRVCRGMVERWFPSLPFISTLFMRCGQMVGDHRNCRDLLENEHCVLVFPEGVKGSGKTIFERYELQRFGTGFVRLALETKAPIVPVAIIGCEETFPSLSRMKPLAGLLGAPYLPLAIPFPLPSKISLRFGKPLRFNESPDASESSIQDLVEQVRSSIQQELDIGLSKRDGKIFTGSGA